tara:strand:+ start:319 stop:630 length:312 start_codon:yes stop_codon:yes gene_type:complete
MRNLKLMLVTCCLFLVAACASHTHVVGNGPQTGETVEARQFYLLLGLYALNDVGPFKAVDTQAMAGGASNYSITTEQNIVDWIISGVGSYALGLRSRTVTVTK